MELVPIGFASLVAAYLAVFLVLTGPGYMLASALQLTLGLTREQRLSVVLLVAGLIAYGFFCLEWLGPSAVAPVSIGLAIVVPVALLAHLMARWPVVRLGGTRWVGAPLSIALLVGLLYLALSSATPEEVLAPVMRTGGSVAPSLIQVGMAAWMAPLAALTGKEVILPATSVVMQVMAIPALWMVARLLPIGGLRVRFALLLIVATGFTFFNAIQFAPKLLAAAYLLVAARPLLAAWARRSVMPRSDVVISTVALILALLVDGVTLFPGIALLALALIFVLPWRVRPVDLAVVAVAAVAVCAPWYLHGQETGQKIGQKTGQETGEPGPGSLVRHLIVGEPAGDATGWSAVRQAYSGLDRQAWIDGRVANAERLVRDADIDRELLRQARALGQDRKVTSARRASSSSVPAASVPVTVAPTSSLGTGSFLTMLRLDQREVFFRALWLLNLAWLLFLAAPKARLSSSVRNRGEAGLVVLWIAGLAAWVGLLLEPAGMRLTQAPYALVLMAMVLAACRLSALPPVWRGAFLLLHAGSGIIIWVATLPGSVSAGSTPFESGSPVVPLAVAVVTGLILTGMAIRTSR